MHTLKFTKQNICDTKQLCCRESVAKKNHKIMIDLEEVANVILGKLMNLNSIPTIDVAEAYQKIYNILLENFGLENNHN